MPEQLKSVRINIVYRDRTSEFMLFDAKIDKNDRIVGAWEIYGKSRAFNDHDQLVDYPCILRRDGIIYFDMEEEYSTNLRDKHICVGELCSVWDDDQRGGANGDEWTYEIRSVHILGDEV